MQLFLLNLYLNYHVGAHEMQLLYCASIFFVSIALFKTFTWTLRLKYIPRTSLRQPQQDLLSCVSRTDDKAC